MTNSTNRQKATVSRDHLLTKKINRTCISQPGHARCQHRRLRRSEGMFVETQAGPHDHVEGTVNLPQLTTESWTSFMRKTTRRRVGEPWQIYSKEKGANQTGHREKARCPMPEMANATMERWSGRLTKVFRCDKPSCREPHEEVSSCCDGIPEYHERPRPCRPWMPGAWRETDLMSGGQSVEAVGAFISG